jgi:plasmid maintenance system antidote protein VapI
MGSSSHSIHQIDRKPEITIRKDEVEFEEDAQQNLALVGEVPTTHLACDVFIPLSSWAGTLRYAVQRSAQDDYEVADKMHISHGYMSRVMRGTANLSGEKLVKFMRITGSLAPLQWLADQMGYELKKKEPTEREVLMARLAQLDEKERRRA